MRIIEVTESNFNKFSRCYLKSCNDFKKIEQNLSNKERKEWIFNKIYELMR